MAPEDSQDPGGFKVTDRRKLQSDEEPTAEAAAKTDPTTDDGTDDAAGASGLPPPDFTMLALSLSQSALMHLGELSEPGASGDASRPATNLLLARHSIDILGMLQEKTRGNLTHEEEKLLENLLYDLRMKFIAKKREG